MMTKPEIKGTGLSAAEQNLMRSDRQLRQVDECRLFHLEEWARTVAEKSREEEDLLLRLLQPESSGVIFSARSEILPENLPYIKQIFRNRSLHDRLFILQTLRRLYPEGKWPEPWPGASGNEELSGNAIGKIAYVQNVYTDAAYLSFSADLTRPRAVYFDNFTDVCEEVFNGICQYGILPLFHSESGKLLRFYRYLDKYDLHVSAVCTVPARESDQPTFTRYALVSKTLPPPDLQPIKGGVRHLELSCPPEPALSPADLLLAADACGLETRQIHSCTLSEYTDPVYLVDISIPSSGDPDTFLTFLSVYAPRTTVQGFYLLAE